MNLLMLLKKGWVKLTTGRSELTDDYTSHPNLYTLDDKVTLYSTHVDVLQVSDGIPKVTINATVTGDSPIEGNDEGPEVIYIKNHPWQVITCNVGWANNYPAGKPLVITAECPTHTAPRLSFNSRGFLKRYSLNIIASDDVVSEVVGKHYSYVIKAVNELRTTKHLHALRAESLPAVRDLYFQVGKYNILTFGIEGRADAYLENLNEIFNRGK